MVTEASSISTQAQSDIESICEIFHEDFDKCFMMADEDKVDSIFLLCNDLSYENNVICSLCLGTL